MRKARAELDRVVQPGYLPAFDNQPSLPYTTALAKETLRWQAVAPIGMTSVYTVFDPGIDNTSPSRSSLPC
jgi:cytochrome P450